MAIDTTGKFWRGDDFTDLVDYFREYQPGGYPVTRVKEMICQQCDGKTFTVSGRRVRTPPPDLAVSGPRGQSSIAW
ncbi:hypothetical protein AB0F68_08005 [Micromonospora sp. NPDC023966]|uniref:hypothetical protein n=1 Tax=Micromonospora sp. NPDC023966 TaxID=3154699 RepID=UPI0033DD76BF